MHTKAACVMLLCPFASALQARHQQQVSDAEKVEEFVLMGSMERAVQCTAHLTPTMHAIQNMSAYAYVGGRTYSVLLCNDTLCATTLVP